LYRETTKHLYAHLVDQETVLAERHDTIHKAQGRTATLPPETEFLAGAHARIGQTLSGLEEEMERKGLGQEWKRLTEEAMEL